MPYLDNDKLIRGPKQPVGKLVFEPDGMRVVIGYCPCEKHKILITVKEARELARKYYRKSRSIKRRLISFLIKHLN